MASHLQGECPERAQRVEGQHFHLPVSTGRWHRRPMWFVYVLRCADDSFYIGETNDVPNRLAKHNEGSAASYTAKRRPLRLVHTETFPTRADCLKRERQLKGWTRAKKEALIAGDKALLKTLSFSNRRRRRIWLTFGSETRRHRRCRHASDRVDS